MTSAARLSWVGSKCWTRTNATPLSVGTALKNLRNASRPPADAPIPATAMDASRPRLAGATLAAPRAFRAEGGALRVGRPTYLTRFRPRPIRFIWFQAACDLRPGISTTNRNSTRADRVIRRSTYRRSRAHDPVFWRPGPGVTTHSMLDDADEHVHCFPIRSGRPLRPEEGLAIAVLEDAVRTLQRYAGVDDRAARM